LHPATKQPRTREFAAALALAVAAFLAYLPGLLGTFIWDDYAHVTGAALRGFDGLLRIWIEPGAVQQYYPLLFSAFWLEHRLWGDSVLGYHVLNVLLHAACAYLLTRILRLLEVRGAWLAGFLFAVHPVCAEAVAWISEQKSTLSGVFYFASALTYLHFDASRKRKHYYIALLLFLCALMSKTVTATLPAALLVVIWWRRGAIRWKQDAFPLAPWLALGASAGLFTAWVERVLLKADGSEYALFFLQRLMLAGRDLWFYAAKVLWPANLIFIYPHWTIDPAVWWQYSFALAFLLLLAVFIGLGHRNRAPLAATLYFAGTLFPVLGFLNVYPFRYSYVADHFQYLACVGILVPAAWAIASLPGRTLVTSTGAVVVAILGILTWRQTHMYSGPETLYRTTLERNPQCWMAENNLAILLNNDSAKRPEALIHIHAALRLRPRYYEAYNNLGSILADMGNQPPAMEQFRAALRIKPDYPEAHINLGNQYFKMPGHNADAIAEYRAALKTKPDLAIALANLGAVLMKDPAHADEGLADLKAAAVADPANVPARMILASALARLPGHAMEAQLEYEDIIARNPRVTAAHIGLGDLLMQSPDTLNDAVEHFRAAVALRPQTPETHVELAIGLFRVPGKIDEAMHELDVVLKLQPTNAKALQMRAVVKARLGR
jgi:tetratricopeptide (TPR) repeat protein